MRGVLPAVPQMPQPWWPLLLLHRHWECQHRRPARQASHPRSRCRHLRSHRQHLQLHPLLLLPECHMLPATQAPQQALPPRRQRLLSLIVVLLLHYLWQAAGREAWRQRLLPLPAWPATGA